MPSLNWDKLNHLQIGKYAEYYVKMEFTSYGFDVYASEVDDHGIDFIVKNNIGQYFEIQVKSARRPQTSYVFASKEKFNIKQENLLMALVLFNNEKVPEMFLIPSKAWLNENDLFRDRDYIDRKSKPEWGLNISTKNIHLLNDYNFEKTLKQIS